MKRAWPWLLALLIATALATTWLLRQKLAAMVDRATTPEDKLLWPVPGYRTITSGYSEARVHPVTGQTKPHRAIDIGAPEGADIVASGDGVVDRLNSTAAGGLQLFIRLTNGVVMGYAHLKERLVVQGQRVRRGQIIAKVGRTGTVTGPHLHLTMSDPFQEPMNPQLYLA